ncbi:long-chain-fatty-acid--CoA ligase [Desulfopila inferna]|uniref:long-chain-fatty-acid--CoA ligase n=1 Tax=Desulfopila inferna TaxID=468528 RepID=UPI001962C941|nr:long-chain fatty acid--CoA ligase [Desulfopila inferna]MBM9602799.1 long-chain fatty acid--CoA ligase [Desulfopila inferna]
MNNPEELNQEYPWLKSYDSGVPFYLNYEDLLLPDFLKRSASQFPDTVALQFQGYEMSYRQLDERVNAFAVVLLDFGVKKGDSVGILLPNTIPCVIAYYAILRIGAIAVMNCPLYSDRELLHQFGDSGIKVLITLDLLGNRMIDLREQTQIKQIVITSIGDYLPFPQNFLFPLVAKRKKLAASVKKANDVYMWGDVMNSTQKGEIRGDIGFADIAMYQYTGGTTGRAKGVILTHENMSKQVQQIAAWFPELKKGAETLLGALPFFHVFGLSGAMNFSIYMAWGNILVPRPEPDKLLQTIKKYRPSFGPLVPTMYIGLINHPDIKKVDMTCFKGFFSGSAPLPLEVLREFEEMTGAVIAEGYGLTESSPVTHINPFNGQRKEGSIGIPIPDTLSKIVDVIDPQLEISSGNPGELLVKGPQVMKGYLHLDEETHNVLEDGWLRTGDVATMDEDGYFFIVDRIKDMVISGGFNVYPREIDEIIYLHPQVKEVSSVGIPHPTRGEQVKSFVVLMEGADVTAEELLDLCRKNLAKYKLPTSIEFIDELPKTIVGKIQKGALKKRSFNILE